MIKPIFAIILLFLAFSCKKGPKNDMGKDISTDIQTMEHGKELFSRHCSSCHNFANTGIGPNLNGITHTIPSSWIKQFIRNNQELILNQDERALKVSREFAGVMPNFEFLGMEEINSILAYMHTFNKEQKIAERTEKPLKDPIKDTIQTSDRTAEIKFLAQVPKTSKTGPAARINKIGYEPSSNRIFINDLRGILYEIKNDRIVPVLAIKDIEENFVSEPGLATGFGSFAFHPDFKNNGLLYTTHSETANTKRADFTFSDSIPKKLQWVVKERKIKLNETGFSMISERELLRADFVGTIHGMQEISFNPYARKGGNDYGKLYICMGDGSSVENGFKQVAIHHDSGVWGSILRIDPLGSNSKNGNYGIPGDNPFTENKDFAKEVWAYGFRNPNKLAWDINGNLYSGDIGHHQIEELNQILPGNFYGWPFREGTFILYPDEAMDKIYPLKENDGDLSVTYPVVQYDHYEGAAISGGYFNQDNLYICGDIPTGQTWIADVSAKTIYRLPVTLDRKTVDFEDLTGSKRVDLRFGQDSKGIIYFFTKADGKIYTMTQLTQNTDL